MIFLGVLRYSSRGPPCTHSKKGFILDCLVNIGERSIFNRTQSRKELLVQDCIGKVRTLLWIFFLFVIILPWKLFIGPLWSEREMQIRESSVTVPTGTTSDPQD